MLLPFSKILAIARDAQVFDRLQGPLTQQREKSAFVFALPIEYFLLGLFLSSEISLRERGKQR